jgi:two-component system, chemotaxis family, protein-glutamate methylesterase/glutaminase
MKLGAQSTYTCPECRGAMVRVEEGAIPRFRCHTGHAFTISTLLAEVTESMESRLWEALRAVEEGILLLKEAARHIQDCEGDASTAGELELRVKIEQERADELRATILKNRTVSEESESVG